MSERRKRIIEAAFCKMDKSGDGRITVEDLQGNFLISQSHYQLLDFSKFVSNNYIILLLVI